MPFFRIALWIVLLVGAMLLPFLPGRHDPLATSLSVSATCVCVGVAPGPDRSGVADLSASIRPSEGGVGRGGACRWVALLALANGSLAAGAVVLATCVTRLVHLWRASGGTDKRRSSPRTVPVALIVVPLAVMSARMALVEPTARWSRDRVIANAGEIIRDIEHFRERTGAYPVAISSLWPDYQPGIIGVERYRYEPSGQAYNLYFEHPSTDFAAHEIVMYNPRGEQDFSSHVV